MMSLLRGEFYKLFRTKSFYVFLVISLMLGVFGPLMSMILEKEFDKLPDSQKGQVSMLMESDMNGFQTGVSINTINFDQENTAMGMLESSFSGNGLQLLLGLFAAIFVSMEFSTGGMKLIVAKGFHRNKIYASKVVTICFANLLFVLIYVVSTFLFSLALWEMGTVPVNLGTKLLTIALSEMAGVFAYSTIAIMLSMIAKSTVAAIIINILVSALAGNIFNILDIIFQRKFNISEYWVITAMEKAGSFSLQQEDMIRIVITMIVTFVVAYFVGTFSFRKAEVI